MADEEFLLSVLTQVFGDRGLRVGAHPDPVARFPGVHPEIGDVKVWANSTVAIGEIISERFVSFDSHLSVNERAERVTNDVVRFLRELFADRLLFWKSTDGRHSGWRERGDSGYSKPLVLDNRPYRTYVWSGPLGVWQALPAIFARGRIEDDREREIVAILLEEGGPEAFSTQAERDVARRLVVEFTLAGG